MKRVLIQLTDNRLCDIVDAGQEFAVAAGLAWHDAPDDVGHDTHEFDGTAVVSKPAPPPAPIVIPSEVTRAQARGALILDGLIDSVQPAINAIADPMQRALAQNDWDNRLTFRRDNPTLVALATALSLTEEQLDSLFTTAAGL